MKSALSRAATRLFLAASLGLAPAGASAGSAASDGTAGSGDDRAGSLVIVGGALSPENDAVFRAVLERRQGGPVCVLPTASAEPESSMDSYLADFQRHGPLVGVEKGHGGRCEAEACAVGVRITKDDAAKARDPEVAATLEACGGFFFTGGDQSRIVDVFRPGGTSSPADRALRRVLARGGVIAGTSAGAAMMTDPMIGAGSSREALDHGVVSEDPADGAAGGVWVRDGMGFLPGALVDQHFLERGRFGRLWAALQATGRTLGFGVGEDTALVVDGAAGREPRAHVVGPSGVLVVDVVDGVDGDAARLWLLGEGDRVAWRHTEAESGNAAESGDRIDLRPAPAEGKEPVAARRGKVKAPRDVFKDDAFHRLLAELAASETREVRLRKKDRGLVLAKDEGFRALQPADAASVTDALFAGPFRITRTASASGGES